MQLNPTLDPSGQPWTKASITAHINSLANRLAQVGRVYSDIQDADCTPAYATLGPLQAAYYAGCRAQYIADENLQQQTANELLLEMREIEAEQRQAQAIAASLVQGTIPSVVGPGAVNVVSQQLPSGQVVQTFQQTPGGNIGPGGIYVPPTAPAGTAGGSTSPTAQPGVGGPLPTAPSAPTGSSVATVATNNGNGEPLAPPGFPFLPNVPKWLVVLGAGLAFYILVVKRVRG